MHMEDKENVTERILQIIEKEGHSVATFARKLDIPWTTANNLLSGRNNPSYDLIVKIIENFDWVDANWLVMGQSSVAKSEEKNVYHIIESQQRTIENQQKTIDRLTKRLVQDLSDKPSKKVANAG
ncbi:DNA-binding helix-turn-helix protein [Hoylesella marshii DSM 16973 = JCM 13450]|uniref:DNA-binding helix-turn-helix protein n=2 Tax=Hoylesella marshii TaxID=189722 RepID=E0NSW6_9BACT|nr:DNA-binding helix-turn-helix protein [Hoylesella marshii DSM 16973 = JCM 13450]